MQTEPLIEQRLSAVEAAVAELRKRLPTPPSNDWLQQVIGCLKDEPAFEEVLAYGRAYRDADRPPEPEDVAP